MNAHPTPAATDLVELESPPVKVSRGLSTYAGLVGALAAIAPVLIDVLFDARVDPATRRLLIIVGAALVAVVIASRTAQAIAAELARGRELPELERRR